MKVPRLSCHSRLSQLVAHIRQLVTQHGAEALSLAALLATSACESHPAHPAAPPSPQTTKHVQAHQHGKYDWYYSDDSTE